MKNCKVFRKDSDPRSWLTVAEKFSHPTPLPRFVILSAQEGILGVATKRLYDLHLSKCSEHVLLLLLHRDATLPISVASSSATNRSASSWHDNFLNDKIPGRHKNSIISFLFLFHSSTPPFYCLSILHPLTLIPHPQGPILITVPCFPLFLQFIYLITVILLQLIWNSDGRMWREINNALKHKNFAPTA